MCPKIQSCFARISVCTFKQALKLSLHYQETLCDHLHKKIIECEHGYSQSPREDWGNSFRVAKKSWNNFNAQAHEAKWRRCDSGEINRKRRKDPSRTAVSQNETQGGEWVIITKARSLDKSTSAISKSDNSHFAQKIKKILTTFYYLLYNAPAQSFNDWPQNYSCSNRNSTKETTKTLRTARGWQAARRHQDTESKRRRNMEE